MDISCPAASVRVDACSRRCITLVGLPPEDALHISLLADILGWQVHMVSIDQPDPASPARASGRAHGHHSPAAEQSQRVPPFDQIGDPSPTFAVLDRAAATQVHPGRAAAAPGGLVLQMAGRVIRVHCDDVLVSRQLAAMGLDRLVPPVPLHALEQLLMLAG